jgi:hypothetical protein
VKPGPVQDGHFRNRCHDSILLRGGPGLERKREGLERSTVRSQEAAKALLRVGLEPEDLERFHVLVTKNQEDALTPAEKADLESYLRVSSFFDLMHAKVRLALKKHS